MCMRQSSGNRCGRRLAVSAASNSRELYVTKIIEPITIDTYEHHVARDDVERVARRTEQLNRRCVSSVFRERRSSLFVYHRFLARFARLCSSERCVTKTFRHEFFYFKNASLFRSVPGASNGRARDGSYATLLKQLHRNTDKNVGRILTTNRQIVVPIDAIGQVVVHLFRHAANLDLTNIAQKYKTQQFRSPTTHHRHTDVRVRRERRQSSRRARWRSLSADRSRSTRRARRALRRAACCPSVRFEHKTIDRSRAIRVTSTTNTIDPDETKRNLEFAVLHARGGDADGERERRRAEEATRLGDHAHLLFVFVRWCRASAIGFSASD
jgi:hypothetical protein